MAGRSTGHAAAGGLSLLLALAARTPCLLHPSVPTPALPLQLLGVAAGGGAVRGVAPSSALVAAQQQQQ